MKKSVFCLSLALLLMVFSQTAYGQAQMVNTHGYSVVELTDDSTGISPVYLMTTDADTTEAFDLRTFTNLSAAFTFGAHGTGGASGLDSNAMRIYFQATIDDTVWATVDSIQAATITAAKLLEFSAGDTTYVKGFTLPKCAYKGRIVFVADAGIEKDGVLIRTKIMKQR